MIENHTNMKYKLLSVNTDYPTNIGDYIQALAASQFLPSMDGFVNREEIAQYNGEECVIIMNGWFMIFPDNWPPSKNIHPIFLSFHMNRMAKEKMLTHPSITYLKAHEPIGCRERYTVNLLQQKGIDSWFTGCLTLTLGNKYASMGKKEHVYFVDPCIPNATRQDRVKRAVTFLSHPFVVYKLSKKLHNQDNHDSLKIRISRSSQFFRFYSKIFTKDCLENAVFLTHEDTNYSIMLDEERMNEAERLIRMYAQAKFVVTSRIHCALPCLGLQTPAYFTQGDSYDEISSCRFDGLTELFNKMTFTSDSIVCDFNYVGKLSESNIVENKKTWEPLAKALATQCTESICNFT